MIWLICMRAMREATGCAEIDQPQAHPAHEILVIKHADDVLGAALRIVNRDAGVLAFDHAVQGFVEGEIARAEKKYRAARP